MDIGPFPSGDVGDSESAGYQAGIHPGFLTAGHEGHPDIGGLALAIHPPIGSFT